MPVNMLFSSGVGSLPVRRRESAFRSIYFHSRLTEPMAMFAVGSLWTAMSAPPAHTVFHQGTVYRNREKQSLNRWLKTGTKPHAFSSSAVLSVDLVQEEKCILYS